MGPNIPGGYPPGGHGSYSVTEYDPRDRGERRRKKRGGFVGFIRDTAVGLLVCAALVLALDAAPLLLGFDPLDAAHFVDAPGLAKIDAFMDGWRHKEGISKMTFSHDGRTITFTDTNGTLTDIDAEGYDYDDSEEYESDLAEMWRILKEWGLY